MKKFLLILALEIFNILVFGLFLWATSPSHPVPSADWLTSPDARLDRLPVALSSAAFDEMAAVSRAGSHAPLRPEGVFFRVAVPVRIRVLSAGVLEEIQILDGPAAGRRGFVPFEWVQSREIRPQTATP